MHDLQKQYKIASMLRLTRISQILVLTMVGLLLAACTKWKEKSPAWANATGAEQFERLWWQDVKEKNWDEVEKHLAATYVYQTSGKTRDREASLEHLKNLEITEYEMGDVEIHPDGDSVVITYTMDMKGTYGGQPLQLPHTRMMSVWQQQKNGWAAIAHADSFSVQ
ncbi:MAG TPA: nuclear transport factor 2 family protein [Terriglobales bacterium]|nr:nuclear transport factor 2 family protein [Terriglobales bacterium]